MTIPWHTQPEPPDGYYRFASNIDKGWEMWVPPDTAPTEDRLRLFQCRNSPAGIVVRSGPPPCVSVGSAVFTPEDAQVYTSDVTSNYGGLPGDQTPRIP